MVDAAGSVGSRAWLLMLKDAAKTISAAINRRVSENAYRGACVCMVCTLSFIGGESRISPRGMGKDVYEVMHVDSNGKPPCSRCGPSCRHGESPDYPAESGVSPTVAIVEILHS